MNILLLGDASNYHATLAKGLRALGHRVTVMSNGSRWQKTDRDIDITRRPGKIGGAMHWLSLWYRHHKDLKGYDIVQISNPFFTELKPARLSPIFDRLKRENGAVFMTALGTDPFYVKECLDPTSPIAYSEWRIGSEPGALAIARPSLIEEWTNSMMTAYASHIYDNLDGVVTALWEYHVQISRQLSPERYAYIGLPIDVDSIKHVGIKPGLGKRPIKLLLGRHSYRQPEKGTDLLEKAARVVEDRHPGLAVLEIVENLPFKEYCHKLEEADIVLDQVYSYTPATNALLAMAMGKNVVSGGEPVFYDFIGEHKLRPIINASPRLDALIETLDNVVMSPEKIEARGRDSRIFVEKHHDCRIVAARAVQFWQKRIKELGR